MMHHDRQFRRVADELRAEVRRRLGRGERRNHVAAYLVARGMRRHHARRFVNQVARRSFDTMRHSPLEKILHETGMCLIFSVAGLLATAVGHLAIGKLVDGANGFAALAGCGLDEVSVAANLAAFVLAVAAAAIAYSMHSVAGAIAAIVGASVGVYASFAGHLT